MLPEVVGCSLRWLGVPSGGWMLFEVVGGYLRWLDVT